MLPVQFVMLYKNYKPKTKPSQTKINMPGFKMIQVIKMGPGPYRMGYTVYVCEMQWNVMVNGSLIDGLCP